MNNKLFTRKINQKKSKKSKKNIKNNKIGGITRSNKKSQNRSLNKNKKNTKKEKEKTKTEFKKINCSPTNEKSINKFTCYENDDLLELKNVWNARHPDKPMNANNPKEIWIQLKNYYSNVCNKESCWIRQMVKNSKLKKDLLSSFAPKSPDEWKKNPNEWLSSLDIIQVMNQYEKKYKNFDFIGPSPIDYDTHTLNGECVWEELCHFNLSSHIKNGYNKIGIIFNTDPHNKGGEHWISLFVDIKNEIIFFFDSVGDSIPNRIKKFVDDIVEQGKQLKTPISFKFDQNHPVEHQKGNTECGMYSLYFIIHMLENKISTNYLKTHKLNDKYVEKFRKIYFNEDV
jgi:hypothetical protein